MPTPRPDQLASDGSYHFSGTAADRPSPLQNRVLPTGEIVADPARGMLMGNRGSIHRPDRTLGVTRWRSPMWICCVLEWGNIKRDVMPPGRWTALFFLDEATALTAGHRPCGYCRYEAHRAFGAAWQQAHRLPRRPRAHEMDLVLHAQRVDRRRRKLTTTAHLRDLPDSTMIQLEDGPALVQRDRVRPWRLTGYQPPVDMPPSRRVEVLTPPAILGALREGYQPLLHPTGQDGGTGQ